jgi:hypothetical protein
MIGVSEILGDDSEMCYARDATICRLKDEVESGLAGVVYVGGGKV